jgi:AcrR family transcriptional regulator
LYNDVHVPSTDEIPLGRRERNRLRMRARIYTAAMTLFVEKGFEQTTIEEIAERADVARGTFFYNFQHKEALITEWSVDRQNRLADKLSAVRSSESLSAALDRCMAALIEINEEDGGLGAVMLTAWVKAGLPITEAPHTADLFAELISAAQARGEVAQDVPALDVGKLLRDAYLGVLYRWLASSTAGCEAMRRELRCVVDVVLSGVLAH